MKTGKYWTLFGNGNIDESAIFWDMVDFHMKLLKTEWEVNQQEGEEEFKCYRYTIWQMVIAMLQKTEEDRDE